VDYSVTMKVPGFKCQKVESFVLKLYMLIRILGTNSKLPVILLYHSLACGNEYLVLLHSKNITVTVYKKESNCLIIFVYCFHFVYFAILI
jgi:hypothetical protein